MLFLCSIFPSKSTCCLPFPTPCCLVALSKAVSGKGKQDPAFQKDRVALSCRQPCGDDVERFSGRSVGATEETAQLVLACLDLYWSDGAAAGEHYDHGGSQGPDKRGCNKRCLVVKLQWVDGL